MKDIKIFKSHDHYEKGIKKSVLSYKNKIILSLGNNGSLVCLQFG